jgi:hypothetical protein
VGAAVHGRLKADLPALHRVVSPWSVDGAGCQTRTVAAIEEAELDRYSPSSEAAAMTTPTTPSPTPAAGAEVLPARKKSGPAKGWKKAKAGETIAAAKAASGRAEGADGVAKVLGIRLTRAQIAATDRWRSRFAGLDLGAAIRVLVDIGLAARPPSVVDPLGLANSTHQRVRQPKTKRT